MVMIPGSNLLKTALKVISKQQFIYYRFRSRELQPNGLDLTSYYPGVPIMGSVQAVPRVLFEKMGLDFQSNHLQFFMQKDLLDVTRDISGDQMEFRGRRYQCLSKTDWFGIDGWDQVLAVEVPQEEGSVAGSC